MSNLTQAFGGHRFDASQVDPASPMGAMPAGKYPMIMTESEVKSNSSNTGSLLKFTLEVIDGEHKGHKAFGNINLTHSRSKAAQEIGQAQFSAMCRATGVQSPDDSHELHNIPMLVTLAFVPAQDKVPGDPSQGQYKPKNEVEAFEPLGSGATYTQPAQQQTQVQQQAPVQQQQQAPVQQQAHSSAPWAN